jgi:hypothetical protein
MVRSMMGQVMAVAALCAGFTDGTLIRLPA